MLDSERHFYRFVREERLFCATLAHLLMQRGPNLAAFLELINARVPHDSQLVTSRLEEAEIYVEFTFLRDYWDTLGGNNDEKRRLIFALLSRVDRLRHYHDESFPSTIPEFNEFFVGPFGRRITHDIVYPGRWSVTTLSERFGREPEEFRDFCRFKWAFNIKPDIVVLPPGSRPLSIEAKLESKEGWYPTSKSECEIFDKLFGAGKGHVRQIELQQFMFGCLLDAPCQSVLIGASKERGTDVPFLTWEEVFNKLDLSSSIGYVRKLIEGNRYLRASAMDRGL
jgi:hypothetical protein